MKRAALLLILIATALVALGCGSRASHASPDNLLSSATLLPGQSARHGSRAVDGVVAADGDAWNTDLTTVLATRSAYLAYDLGSERKICCAFVHADSNDTYTLSVSNDGQSFSRVWEARPTRDAGLRSRSTDRLEVTARYVRLGVEGGDGRYALSEVGLYSERPAVFPPELVERTGLPVGVQLRTQILLLGLAFALLLASFWLPARFESLRPVLVAAVAAAALGFVWKLVESWPPGGLEVSLVRATAAGVAFLIVAREAFDEGRTRFARLVGLGGLTACAALAVASFYNLGHPQFVDHRSGAPRLIHDFDLRVYYPAAKYWKELRYDGVYLASSGALLEDAPGGPTDFPIRNLRDFRVQKLSELSSDMQAVRARFSPERWSELKRDMRYFRETMGRDAYVGSMLDHGANATPLWMTVAHGLFRFTQANDRTLNATALLDPLLLAAAFVAIAKCFNLRTALLSMIVFGANDFYMTGSNWAGATLRHDWLALLALGICALAKERWKTGGVLLMLSALIRAFPALALFALCAPAIGWAIDYKKTHGKLPSIQAIRDEQKPLIGIVTGAALCGVAVFALTTLTSGIGAWPDWFARSVAFNQTSASNEISLRVLLAGSEPYAGRLLGDRALLRIAMTLAFVFGVFYVAHRAKLHQAATLGVLLTPIVFNPTNYYVHIVFLAPLLIATAHDELRGRDAAISGAVLLLCALLYLAVPSKDEAHKFWVETCLFMLWFAATLGFLAAPRRSEREAAS